MEESWRFRPTQGNICPTCLISHFPFCSRPLPFDRIQNDPTFHRLFPDPHHHRGFPSPHLPLPHENPYGIPRPLAPNFDNQFPAMIDLPVADRLQRGGFHPPPRFDYGGTEFMRGESIESDRINKRMRVDDMGFGPSVPPPIGGYNSHPTRMPLEDERRLSLIRSHGAPQLHSTFSTGPGDHPAFEETRGSEWRPRAPASSYYDRTSSMLHQESGFDSAPKIAGNGVYQEKKEPQLGESGFGFEKQNIGGFHSNVESVFQRKMDGSREDSFFPSRNEPMQQPQYSHNNNLGYPHYSYRPSNVPTSALDYVNTSCNDTSSNLVREEDRHFMNKDENRVLNFQKDDLNRQQHILHHVPNLIPYESRGKYTEHQATGFNHAQEFPYHHESNNALSSSGSAVPNHGNSQNTHFHTHESDTRRSFEVEHPLSRNVEGSTPHLYYQEAKQLSSTKIDQPGVHFPRFNTGNGLVSVGQVQVPALDYSVPPPPLPPLPPPPLPMEPPGPPPTYAQPKFSPPKTSSSMYSIPVASSAATPLLHPPALESQPFPPRNPSPDKPKLIDAGCLFKQPNRATRPDHIVIILRGLPGSGKSFLAKMLRDLEVESGADAPRIHSMDDYFMTEVEKVEESESSKSSSLGKGKKRITKKVMEYCYEPEMEEAYRSSMLKAFKKTLDEGMFTFIIVDDRNLRVADFAQFWANAKRSGYEVYLLEANYKDPAGCAARNIHGFTSDDIKRMAEMWEEAPSFYLRLDTQSLFCGDDLKEHGIQEVDMDMEDAGGDEGSSGLHDMNSMKKLEPPLDDLTHGFVEDEGRWNVERDEPIGVKELGRSKWSDDVDEEDIERSDGNGKSNALSGLIQAYSKGDKSVHWGDQVGKTGFAISATRKANSLSLVIGPGAGYNLKSNPLPEEETIAATHTGWQSKKKNVFQEQLQAERESFRAVFDRRRHRIGGLQMEEE